MRFGYSWSRFLLCSALGGGIHSQKIGLSQFLLSITVSHNKSHLPHLLEFVNLWNRYRSKSVLPNGPQPNRLGNYKDRNYRLGKGIVDSLSTYSELSQVLSPHTGLSPHCLLNSPFTSGRNFHIQYTVSGSIRIGYKLTCCSIQYILTLYTYLYSKVERSFWGLE